MKWEFDPIKETKRYMRISEYYRLALEEIKKKIQDPGIRPPGNPVLREVWDFVTKKLNEVKNVK